VKRKSCSSLFILKLTLCNRRCQREEVCWWIIFHFNYL
jgi:hypothetical protein